MYAAAFGLSNS
jgi:peroxin-11B